MKAISIMEGDLSTVRTTYWLVEDSVAEAVRALLGPPKDESFADTLTILKVARDHIEPNMVHEHG